MRKSRHKIVAFLLLFLFVFPQLTAKAAMPEINGSSALSFDLDTKELIFTKNIDAKIYPASITKLLTALVFSDYYGDKKTEYLAYKQEGKLEVPYAIYWNLRNIAVGTEISADDMMHALLLGSANDAAVVIALNISETIPDFAALMNEKAKSIGMTNSNFVTTTGIHDDNHYSTAYDLIHLMEAAYNDPWISEVSLKQTYEMSSKTRTLGTIESKNKHIGIHGNTFGKTGYTGEAGRCFAGIYERDGRKIGNIILNSFDDRVNVLVFEDSLRMVDAAFNENTITKLDKDNEVGVITVPYRPYVFIGPTKEIEVPIKSNDTISVYGNDVNLNESSLTYDYVDLKPKEIKKDTVVGTAKISERLTEKTVALVSTVDVSQTILKTHLLSYILIVLFTIVFVFTIFFSALRKRQRKIERRRRIEAGRRNKKYVDEHTHRRKKF